MPGIMIVITHVDNANMSQIMIINIILIPCNLAAGVVFEGMAPNKGLTIIPGCYQSAAVGLGCLFIA